MIFCFLVGEHLLRRRESMKYKKWFILTIPSMLAVGKTSFLLCIERFFNVFFHIVRLFARVRCISPLNVRTHASEHVLLKDTYFCAGIVKLLAIIRLFSSLGFQTTFFQTTLNALCIVSRSLPDGWIEVAKYHHSYPYMSHSQMLGKFEYTLPAKFWRLVGCTEMLSW